MINRKEIHDLFRDPEDPLLLKAADFRFENNSDDAQLVRGLASYAAAHAGRKFRVHSFGVLVCGKYARFFRLDRDGLLRRSRIRSSCADLDVLALRQTYMLGRRLEYGIVDD